MKRVLLCWLICAFVISSVSVCFANDTEDARQSRTEQAGIVEDVTGTDYIADNYLEERDVYIVNNADSSISIPKDGGDTIIFDSNGTKPIGFALPEEAEISRGQLLGNGTVLYDSPKGNVSMGVQALSRTENGMTYNAVRSLITIMDASAPHEYSFKFTLPRGYRLVWDYDYDDGQDELDDGTIFIVDENDEVVRTIDPAWAKDGEGKDIATHYTITGNTLVQHVDFNENTKFPVVADPTEGDTKTSTKYLTKKQVKKTRDEYAGKPKHEFWDLLMTLVGGRVPELKTAWKLAKFMETNINATSYATWNKIYEKFPKSKNRVKVVTKYRWHHKGAWVATGIAKYSYVTK